MENWYNFENDGSGWETEMEKLKSEWEKILERTAEQRAHNGISLFFQKEGKNPCWLGKGYADVEGRKNIGKDTIFRLYSMTKPVTAAAAMTLVEDGLLELNTPVGEYLPGFRHSRVWCGDHSEAVNRPVLVADLLSMTSGLSYMDNDTVTENETGRLITEVEKSLNSGKPITTEEFANRAGEIPLLFQPGSSWKYGISADILGAVIEQAAKKSFGEVLKEKIFVPLGMNDTGFYVPDEKRDRLAKAYEKQEEKPQAPYRGNFLGISNKMDKPAAFESGGAGLVSTVSDYARFSQMLLNGGSYRESRVLRSESVDLMTRGGLNEAQKLAFAQWFGQRGYDYGWLMRVLKRPEETSVSGLKGEYCWDGLLGCCFINYPQEKMTLLVMQQQLGGENPVPELKKALIRCFQK